MDRGGVCCGFVIGGRGAKRLAMVKGKLWAEEKDEEEYWDAAGGGGEANQPQRERAKMI